jgi:hypothetical protein
MANKGLSGWFEVFKTGSHTDSKGNTRNWTKEDLDRAVTTHNTEHHEAPLVVGHPKTNSPAWGWVDGLKREGNTLYAKAKQVSKDFENAVAEGRYKKRSISFYPDGSVRHLGFLGGQAPAVKGLADISFKEEEEFWEYEETVNNAPVGDGGDNMLKTVEELEKELADEKTAKAAAEKEAAEFKEKANKATADFAESERCRVKKEISDFVEQGIKEAKILPVAKEQGIVEFMEVLAGIESAEPVLPATGPTLIEFAEGDNKTKVCPLEWFKKFVTSFGEHPLFREMTKQKDEKTGQDAEFAEADKEGAAIAATVPSV